MKTADIDLRLARIVGNTRRKKRRISIPELAADIAAAADALGGISKLSERVILSSTMLRQFLAVEQLCPPVRLQFDTRELDSVDLCAQLATLGEADQLFLAKAFVEKKIQTKDVRDFRELRQRDPDAAASEILEKLVAARPVRQHVAEIVLRGGASADEVRDRITSHIDPENLVEFELEGSILRFAVTPTGKEKLRNAAKNAGLTLEQAAQMIASGRL